MTRFEKITRILGEVDPMGIVFDNENDTEYSPEAARIERYLNKYGYKNLKTKIRKIFKYMFSMDISNEDADRIEQEILEIREIEFAQGYVDGCADFHNCTVKPLDLVTNNDDYKKGYQAGLDYALAVIKNEEYIHKLENWNKKYNKINS